MPPTRGYRLRKFYHRHRPQVIAVGLVLFALVCGVIGTTVGLVEAKNQRDAAEDARVKESIQRGIAVANLEEADKARMQAQREKQNALAVAASSMLDQGVGMCDGGDVTRGVLLMAKALAPAIDSGDTALEEAVRFNLGAWLPCAYRVRWFEGWNHFAACSNPDGSVVVTGSNQGELQVWDTGPGQKPPQKFQLNDGILRLAWQPNGRHIAILCRDGTLRLWQYGSDFQSARVIRLTKTRIENRGAIVFHPDGSRLLVGAVGPSVNLLNVATGESTGIGFTHDSMYCDAVDFSPDGKRVVVATPLGTARVYDARTGKT